MKTAIVHIGAHKTGSSAIQTSLRREQAALADAGLRYFTFREGRATRGQLLSLALSGKSGQNSLLRSPHETREDAVVAAMKAVIALSRQVRACAEPYVILSEEALMRVPDPQRFARLLGTMFDRVQIVAYVRAPDTHLPSSIDQRVRGGAPFKAISKGSMLTWRPLEHLDRYAEAFGAGAMIVRNFHRDNLVGGAPQTDFAHVLSGIVGREVRLNSTSVQNASLPGAVTCALLLENEARHRAGIERTSDWLRYRRALVDELRKSDWLNGLEKLCLTNTPLLGHIQSSFAEDCAELNARYLQGQKPLSTDISGPSLSPRQARRALHAWMGRYHNPEVSAKILALQVALRSPDLPTTATWNSEEFSTRKHFE